MTLLACIVFTLWQPCPFIEPLCDSIYWSEGGPKARRPYGILSIDVTDDVMAREICRQSVVANYERWQVAGKPGGDTREAFVRFMARRWCPITVDPHGHKAWVTNVTRLLNSRLTAARPVVFSLP